MDILLFPNKLSLATKVKLSRLARGLTQNGLAFLAQEQLKQEGKGHVRVNASDVGGLERGFALSPKHTKGGVAERAILRLLGLEESGGEA